MLVVQGSLSPAAAPAPATVVEGAWADEMVIGENLSVLQSAAKSAKGLDEAGALVTEPDWCR
jgi:hypothetical protein